MEECGKVSIGREGVRREMEIEEHLSKRLL